MKILELTNEKRMGNGIRHNDYKRYRKSCDNSTLFKAEKCYFYSIELKNESKEFYRKHVHSNKRLRKAVKWAELLISEQNELLGKLEAQAYHSLLLSHYEMQMENFKKALDQYKQTIIFYEQLALVAYSSHHETLIQQAIDEIQPCIRYCAYSLRSEFDIKELLELKSGLIPETIKSEINEILASKMQQETKTIGWRSHEFQLSGKLLEDYYTIQNISKHLNETQTSEYYDEIFGVYWQVTKLAEQNLQKHKDEILKAKSSKSDEITTKLAATFDFFVFSRIITSFERILFLIETSVKNSKNPTENIKLAMALVRVTNEFQSLNYSDDSKMQCIIENFKNLAEIAVKIYHAINYSFKKRFDEAITLLDQVKETLNSIELSTEDVELCDGRSSALILKNLLAQITKSYSSSYGKAVGLCYLFQSQSTQVIEKKFDELSLQTTPLFHLMKTDSVVNAPLLVDKNMMPIPTRPLVYDTAYSYIDFPTKNLELLELGKERVPYDDLSNIEDDEPKVENENEKPTFFKNVLGLWK